MKKLTLAQSRNQGFQGFGLGVLFLFITSLIQAPLALSAPKTVTVRGIVGNFNDHKVTLNTDSGPIVVPRSAFKNQDIRPDRPAEAKLDVHALLEANNPGLKFKQKDRAPASK